MSTKEIILKCLNKNIKKIFADVDDETFQRMEEIRLRADKPLMVKLTEKEAFMSKEGNITRREEDAYFVSQQDISEALELMSGYSLYAFEEELKKGYITISGGHRVGLCGKIVYDGGHIKTMKWIGSLNIRVCHEILDCADAVMADIIDGDAIFNTLIASPPGCGKTTLLRDLIRQVSNGYGNKLTGRNVSVVDERSEIAGCYLGIPQNDVGVRTDVLDCCSKAEGMLMLLRTMSPTVIAVDEIGGMEDIIAIDYIVNSGIKLLCSLHAYNIGDIQNKPALNDLLSKKIFKRIIFLKGDSAPGTIAAIYNENFERIR